MRSSTKLLVAVTLLLCLIACERPRPLSAPPPIVPPAPKPSEIATPEPGSKASIAEARGAPSPTANKPAAAWVASYSGEKNTEERRAIIAELLGGEPVTGVAAVGELLKLEKRAELRVALFDALDSFDGQTPAKLALIRGELLENRASGDAREAAIDALLNIQDRTAIPIWQALLSDPDESLHDVARQAIAALESLR